MKVSRVLLFAMLCVCIEHGAESEAAGNPGPMEFHVSVTGDDGNEGSAQRPLRTISAAARRARAGDTITVHAGVYRECVSPPRGGDSNKKRIVYQAAEGEAVEIAGSERVTGWEKVGNDTWTVAIPNEFFGDFNPYRDLIRGDWFDPRGRDHHTGAVYLNGDWLTEGATLEEVLRPAGQDPLWFGRVDENTTSIWAQFKGVDPNNERVEINVRRTVFYPERPGINYLTVRGFVMRHAATPWAPPTAEQVGLLGTHWSRGWIIESNTISHSRCTGITLGKYGDQWDNTSANTAEGYVETIRRALENGWTLDNIGGHIVRNNTISHCEQAGIVGSLGAVGSIITGNTIHDIHVQRLFSGAEMAGIKIHAAIDAEISHNRIFRTVRGIWLDWMAQGTRVTGNLLYENASEDLFVEVNHGPFVVDNNLFLSERALLDMSQGGAYAHNLVAGRSQLRPELSRSTPFHPAHSTSVAGLRPIDGGDDRFYNNLYVNGNGLSEYDAAALPVQIAGNVFLRGATPSRHEADPLARADFDPGVELQEDDEVVYLRLALDRAWRAEQRCAPVTTDLLGLTRVSNLPYVQPDNSPLRIDTDYLGIARDSDHPYPGPFELPQGHDGRLKIWPKP